MIKRITILIFWCILLAAPCIAVAGGPFGPPQPLIAKSEGLHTGIGYWYHEDVYKDGTDHVIRQNQLYTEVGYGSQDAWEGYVRLGVADMKVLDAFSPQVATTTASKHDFSENWKFFGTLGAKGFHRFNAIFGLGAFIQGTYYFQDFTDEVSGTRSGAPFTANLRMGNLWNVNVGLGLQANLPYGTRLYAGPYVYYGEAKTSPSAGIPGPALTGEDRTLKNKTVPGGYAGIVVPLTRGFFLNLEGLFAERFSAGGAVTYSY